MTLSKSDTEKVEEVATEQVAGESLLAESDPALVFAQFFMDQANPMESRRQVGARA